MRGFLQSKGFMSSAKGFQQGRGFLHPVKGFQLGALSNPFPSYLSRVLADSGAVKDATATTTYMKFCQSKGLLKNIKFGWLGEAGGKVRTSGVNSYWTKLYSLFGAVDSTQTTELSQMFRGGDISPYERYCMKNVNGASRYMTHSNVSFLANEAWSLTTIVNAYGSNTGTTSRILGNDTVGKTRIEVSANGGTLYVYGETANGSIAISQRKGLRTIIHLTYNGAGVVTVYVNGALTGTINVNSAFTFNTINRAGGGQYFYGKNMGVLIRSGEMTALQVTGDCTQLDGIYAEYTSVQIGAQHWATSNFEAVCTPQGNLIQEMQASANVEKITNGGFDTDTVWTKQTGITILGGLAHFLDSPSLSLLYQTATTTIDKWYKITYTVSNYVTGGVRIAGSFGTNSTIRTGNGTFIEYLKAGSTTGAIYLRAQGTTTLDIDNFSVQEIGWSGSQELYDGIYAATAGTVEQKTYSAVKAASMWSHYNNDVVLGAVYGKLYNWFAVKLLQMDIDYFNVANPATPWGWRVPTDADWNTLITNLGGSAVAGGKMKVTGTSYFNAPNTGADNSSGFSALPVGRRVDVGTFSLIGINQLFLSITEFSSSNQSVYYLDATNASILTTNQSKRYGNSLRLIKA
jgi:uncharacterized protein (TIGR02145 family)